MTASKNQKPKKQATRRTPKEPNRLQDFSKMTIEKEAEFWDTHDSTDYEDEFEDVDDDIEFIVVRQQNKKPMTVRLEPDILTLLTQEARAQGVGPSTMARMAILKYLKDSGRGTYISRRKRKAPARKGSRGAA